MPAAAVIVAIVELFIPLGRIGTGLLIRRVIDSGTAPQRGRRTPAPDRRRPRRAITYDASAGGIRVIVRLPVRHARTTR